MTDENQSLKKEEIVQKNNSEENEFQPILDLAYSKKQEADKLIKENKLTEAYQLYQDSSKLISDLNKKQSISSSSKIITEIYIPANLNLSYIDLKQNNWESAIKHCTKVLRRDDKHIKARYRRCKAYIHAGLLNKADDDLFELEEKIGGTKELEELEKLYEYNKTKSEGDHGVFLKKMAKNMKGKNIFEDGPQKESLFKNINSSNHKESLFKRIFCCCTKKKKKKIQ